MACRWWLAVSTQQVVRPLTSITAALGKGGGEKSYCVSRRRVHGLQVLAGDGDAKGGMAEGCRPLTSITAALRKGGGGKSSRSRVHDLQVVAGRFDTAGREAVDQHHCRLRRRGSNRRGEKG